MKRPWRAEYRVIEFNNQTTDAPWHLIGTYATEERAREAAVHMVRWSKMTRFFRCHYRVTCRDDDGSEKELEP